MPQRNCFSVTPGTQSVIDNTLSQPKSSKNLQLRPREYPRGLPEQRSYSSMLHGALPTRYSEWMNFGCEWRMFVADRERLRNTLQIANMPAEQLHARFEFIARFDQAGL